MKLEFEEVKVNVRLAKLEATAEYLKSDVAELKGNIRRLNDKIDDLKDSISARISSMRHQDGESESATVRLPANRNTHRTTPQ